MGMRACCMTLRAGEKLEKLQVKHHPHLHIKELDCKHRMESVIQIQTPFFVLIATAITIFIMDVFVIGYIVCGTYPLGPAGGSGLRERPRSIEQHI